ncbi:MAG: hypothetical protein WKF97_25105 [Chitinophagaceae bacterium]
MYTRTIAAKSGQKVINELMGSFIGRILVRSSATAPSIQNGIERAKTKRKNFSGDFFADEPFIYRYILDNGGMNNFDHY